MPMLSISKKSTILNLLDNILGSHIQKKDENYAYYCPFCHHYKHKLEIDIESQQWHCWVCNNRGTKIKNLIKKLKNGYGLLSVINEIYPNNYSEQYASDEKSILISLPSEFISLSRVSKDPDFINAKHYITSRGITKYDIYKYNIGYCDDGIYAERIIIPSYSDSGLLNYFVGRDYTGNNLYSYKNPPLTRNIIGFDLHINWSEPINLVEGGFDAIAVKRNSIPLFGKFLSKKLRDKILIKNVKELNIILDSDALSSSVKMAEDLFNEGINIKIIISKNNDPAGLGFLKIWDIINNTNVLEYSDLLKFKLRQ